MLTLNSSGQDARETWAVRNRSVPGFASIRDLGWLNATTLLVLSSEGWPWRVDLTPITPVATPEEAETAMHAIRAGGGTWSGQAVVGGVPVVINAPAPFPDGVARAQEWRIATNAAYFIADVARDTGAILTVEMPDPGVVAPAQEYAILHVDLPSGAHTTIRTAGALERPPRLSPCGRVMTWLERDGRQVVAKYALVMVSSPVAQPLPLPSASPLITPRAFECFDSWWVLAYTTGASLTLTRLDGPQDMGYQWLPPQRVTDADVYLTDQVYVAWEMVATDGVMRSNGFAPGLDLERIMVNEAAAEPAVLPPTKDGVADAVDDEWEEAIYETLIVKNYAGSAGYGIDWTKIPALRMKLAGGKGPHADLLDLLNRIETRLVALESTVENAVRRPPPVTSDPMVAIVELAQRVEALRAEVRATVRPARVVQTFLLAVQLFPHWRGLRWLRRVYRVTSVREDGPAS